MVNHLTVKAAIRLPFDHQGLGDIRHVLEAHQLLVVIDQYRNILSGTDLAQLLGLLVQVIHFIGGAGAQSQLRENRRQGIAGFCLHRVPGLLRWLFRTCRRCNCLGCLINRSNLLARQ